jgi:hypothetical protein
MTLTLMKGWEKLFGIDFVSQAIAHNDDRDKQRLLGEWAKLHDS